MNLPLIYASDQPNGSEKGKREEEGGLVEEDESPVRARMGVDNGLSELTHPSILRWIDKESRVHSE